MPRDTKRLAPARFQIVVRCAKTGQFLKPATAKRRPKTTVTERIRRKPKAKAAE